MYSVYLLTGSNLGDRKSLLQQCNTALLQYAGNIIEASSLYETEAWGIEGLPPHLNQAIHLHTALEPIALLSVIHSIEHSLGRVREQKWGVRAIDIDIIYFGQQIINTPELFVPHPLLQERRFVLTPLVEIAKDFIHPIFQKTNAELLESTTDMLSVVPIAEQ